MTFLPLSQSYSKGLTPHTEKNRSQSKVSLSLGSAEDNLYLQAVTSSQIINLLWSLAVGFRSKERLCIFCIWYEGLVQATDQLITEHFSEYNEVSFKDSKFF